MLGLVARHIYSELLLVQDDEDNFGLQEEQNLNDAGKPDDAGEITHCVCGNTHPPDNTYDFMLDCDKCHVWFHGKCVGIMSVEDLPEQYICDRCLIKDQVKLELARMKRRREETTITGSGKRKKNSSSRRRGRRSQKRRRRYDTISSEEEEDEEKEEENASPELNSFVARQLLLNFITLQAQSGDRNAALSRQYLIVQWIRHDREKFGDTDMNRFQDSSQALLEQWNLPESQIHQIASLSTLCVCVCVCSMRWNSFQSHNHTQNTKIALEYPYTNRNHTLEHTQVVLEVL